jgi:hypothetical protein
VGGCDVGSEGSDLVGLKSALDAASHGIFLKNADDDAGSMGCVLYTVDSSCYLVKGFDAEKYSLGHQLEQRNM